MSPLAEELVLDECWGGESKVFLFFMTYPGWLARQETRPLVYEQLSSTSWSQWEKKKKKEVISEFDGKRWES